ncbi:MAG: NUDIX hydrolase [Sciscionella sp.]
MVSDATILAAGAVLWRRADVPDATGRAPGTEVALVHRPRYDDWSLPKGKLDADESLPQAAVRELAEETGFTAVLGRKLRTVRYSVAGVPKSVTYYAATPRGGAFRRNDEVDELRWCTPGQARALLHYAGDAEVLDTFLAVPAELRMLLLLRHAKAGNRSDWTCMQPDAARPLSAAGRRQALALSAVLPLYGALRIYAAPRVRCRDTVAPFARAAGQPIRDEVLFSEEGYWPHPEAARNRLLEILQPAGVPVICSQGGVIPDLIARLAGCGSVRLDTVRSKKGSLWVLGFDAENRLASADYLPSALGDPH